MEQFDKVTLRSNKNLRTDRRFNMFESLASGWPSVGLLAALLGAMVLKKRLRLLLGHLAGMSVASLLIILAFSKSKHFQGHQQHRIHYRPFET